MAGTRSLPSRKHLCERPGAAHHMTAEPVSVGDGSWLGHGAVILPGSRIGKHVVVAAGAIVAGLDVPDFSVVAGVPARVVRRYVAGEWRAVAPREGSPPGCGNEGGD